jgi:hypothetical protein
MTQEVSLQPGDGNQPDSSITNQPQPQPSPNGSTGADYETSQKATNTGAPVQSNTKPISEARLRANRENAKKSTGPRTAHGKGYSSRNATKHGLLSNPVLYSPNGTPINEELHALRARLEEQYGTGDVRADLLLDTVVVECWRQQKALHVEAQAFKSPDHFSSIGRMPHLQRYRTASQNAMMQSLELLGQPHKAGAPASDAQADDEAADSNPHGESSPQYAADATNAGASDDCVEENQLNSDVTPVTTTVVKAA